MSDAAQIAISVLLVLGSFFFVAAEYALVGSRRPRIETMAKRGSKPAQRLLKHLEKMSALVANNQIAITMVGIAMGSVTEPYITEKLTALLPLGVGVSKALSYILITYFLVVLGELVPKYLTLRSPERIAMVTTPILAVVGKGLGPIGWLAQVSAGLVLKPLGVDLRDTEDPRIAKDELQLLLRGGRSELDAHHADLVSRALKLDDLTAEDIMIHRLDMKWLDLETPREQLLGRLGKLAHTRIPVCRGDIDDLVGIVYLSDVVKSFDSDDFSLEKLIRPAVVVPESLSLDRIVPLMRVERTQILIVVDEYGGTSGLITLEDVVEEIFGELEDKVESDRDPIELLPSGRVSARAEVRFDELLERLSIDLHDPSTDTLAQMFADQLGRVPKIGDQIDTTIGKMRVENMARRRLTRVSIRLKDDYRPSE